MNVIKAIAKRIYIFFARIYYRYKKKVFIEKNTLFSLKTFFEGNNYIHNNVNVINSFIGDSTYISENSNISNSYVGRYSCIAKNVNVVIGNHPIKNNVSIHPAFYSTQKQSGYTYVEKNLYKEYKYVEKNYSVKIGNDVWIGQNALLLEGIEVGDGAIIGAGSIVTKNVPSYAVVCGVPAKIIKYRFNDDIIKFLLFDKWWNKDKKWIEKNKHLFLDIDEYIRVKNANEKL